MLARSQSSVWVAGSLRQLMAQRPCRQKSEDDWVVIPHGDGEAEDTSSQQCSWQPPQRQSQKEDPAPFVQVPPKVFYEEQLDQAIELYRITDPEASEKALQDAAHEAAWLSTLGEAARLGKAMQTVPANHPWAGAIAEAANVWARDGDATMQAFQEVRSIPGIRRVRRPSKEKTSEPFKETVSYTTDEMTAPPNVKMLGAGLNRWQNLMFVAMTRKEWAVKGHMLRMRKHGLPADVYGKATGFGKHIGRWGNREVTYLW